MIKNVHFYVDIYTEIINSFIKVKQIRIHKSYIESRNAKIERLLINAYGFANFKRARNYILYCINKDDIYKI